MNLAPVVLRHGERYSSLTVLHKIAGEGNKYRCACICGFRNVQARASALMKGRVKSCKKCRQPVCKDERS